MLRFCLFGCAGLGSASCEYYHGGMTGLAPYNPDSQIVGKMFKTECNHLLILVDI